VISELEDAERLTAGNSVLTLQFCVNYGARAEIADAAAAIAADVAAGRLKPGAVDEKVFARYLDEPEIPDVDLFIRSSGEQRISNFLLWQSAYAEFVFLDTLFPDFDRRHLWHACEIYASRDRRYGGATPNPLPAWPAARPSAAGTRRGLLAPGLPHGEHHHAGDRDHAQGPSREVDSGPRQVGEPAQEDADKQQRHRPDHTPHEETRNH
jgi:undecaprenyl diphosphate synthase